MVSRTHPGLIKRLFELEVPEIADGIVEIKACAREPGHRTKIAVWSNDHNVDPVGACVGARGARVRMVVTELRGEKIDIVPFCEDQADFVAKALSPAKVKEVRIHEDTGVAEVIVPDYQLSLAIGKEGQNARLAARLTGWRVDIKSETQLADEEAGISVGAEADVEYAEGEWVPERRHRRAWSGTPPTARSCRPPSGPGGERAGHPGGRHRGRRRRRGPDDAAERPPRGRDADADRGRRRRRAAPSAAADARSGRRRLSGTRPRPAADLRRLPPPGAPDASWCASCASPDGAMLVDRTAPGRGAWLCAGYACECLARAVSAKAFGRAFRAPVDGGCGRCTSLASFGSHRTRHGRLVAAEASPRRRQRTDERLNRARGRKDPGP